MANFNTMTHGEEIRAFTHLHANADYYFIAFYFSR